MLRAYIISQGYQFDATQELHDAIHSPKDAKDHIASVTEAREYLELLLNLATTFDEPCDTKIHREDFFWIIQLLAIAEVSLSESDKIKLRDIAAKPTGIGYCHMLTALPKFDNLYLDSAINLHRASYLIDVLDDFHSAIDQQRDYTTKAIYYEKLLNSTPKWHLIKRFKFAKKYAFYYDAVEYWKAHIHGHDIDHMYNPRCISTINSLYQHKIEYGWPLIFFKSPLQAKQTFFGDSDYEAKVRTEWENSNLHHFGDKKLWRLITLNRGVRCSIGLCYPTNNYEEWGEDIPTADALHQTYPEFTDLFRFTHSARDRLFATP